MFDTRVIAAVILTAGLILHAVISILKPTEFEKCTQMAHQLSMKEYNKEGSEDRANLMSLRYCAPGANNK